MKSLVINREDLKHNIRKIKEIAKDRLFYRCANTML